MPKYKHPIKAIGYVISEADSPEEAALDIYYGRVEVNEDTVVIEYYDTDSDEFPEEVK
jgi:hypothetical protein